MAGLTWLHLSDWHQEETKFNRNVVCGALIEDIKKREEISPRLRKIDFIVFSGDVANAGQPDEYKKATEDLFKPVLGACNLGPDRLFIVPGNHDLDQELIPVGLLKPLKSNEEVETWWSDERKRAQLFQPFQAFQRFFTDCTGQALPEYANTCLWEIDGKKIGMLGINSAWMCSRHKDKGGKYNDQGYLCIGEPQIYGPLKDLSNSDLKIAVFHHPLDWLAPFDLGRIEVYLKQKCNFILHGHAHKPGVSANKDNFGYYIVIPAGACYNRSKPYDSGYTFSYNYVHLDFNTDKGVVFLRRWSDLNRIWRRDDETCPPSGEFNFSISGSDKAPVPHQIPPPPADFEGREEEISDILSNFEKGATITGLRGMGGIGKTALALVLAEKLKSHFPDGQIFIEMRGTSRNPDMPPVTPEEAMAQVIRAYNPVDRLPDNPIELRGLYLSVLTGKCALLLMDNAANSEQVEPLLPPAGCSVLITSRIKFTLPGLVEKDLDVLPSNKASELLLKIAPRIGDRAEELAKLCGCLPLALRNAAKVLAEKRDLGVSEYERRLSDKIARLELVKASFSLSYDLLTPGRKKQWRRLSIFPEDFDRNAATAVLKMAPGPSAEALSDLVRWSLVDFVPIPNSEDGRYRLHDLARLFAESCLEPGELVDAQQKHAKYYSKVLSQAENLYKTGEENLLAGLKLFDSEWANIKVGQAWVKSMVRASRKLTKSEMKFVMQLASSYANDGVHVLDLRLHPQDRIGWFETGLAAARMRGHHSAEGAALNNLGLAYSDLGETRKAIDYYEQALAVSYKVGGRQSEGANLGNLGSAYYELGEMRKAIDYYEQALVISRDIGDRWGEGTALGDLGNTYSHLGETRKAIDYYEQALVISRDIGDRRGEGNHLGNLGPAYSRLGETRKAIEYYEQALAIASEIGDRRGEGYRLGNLGLAYYHLGETRKAIEYYEQALAIASEIGDRRGEGNRLDNLGLAYSGLGEPRKAIEYCDQALAISREIGDRCGEGNALGNLGSAYFDLGEPRKAIDYYEQALAIAREIGDRMIEGENLCNLGKAYSYLNETDKAIEHCIQSLDIVRKIEYPKIEGDALCNLGKVYADLGEASKAIDYCDQALGIFQKMEYRRGEGDALFNKSLALDKLGQRQEAIDNAKSALDIFEQIESPQAEKVRQKLAEWQGSSNQEN
jgi:tetratricopeptide (TPR) repeat protein/predicted phosphodiesterase